MDWASIVAQILQDDFSVSIDSKLINCLLSEEPNDVNITLIITAALLRKQKPNHEFVKYLVNILKHDFSSDSLRYRAAALEGIYCICFNKEVKSSIINPWKEHLRTLESFPSVSDKPLAAVNIQDFCGRKQLRYVLDHHLMLAIFNYLESTLDDGDTSVFDQIADFISFSPSTERKIILTLFEGLTRLFCQCIAENRCDRSVACGFLNVWTTFADKFPTAEISLELASALLLLFATIENVSNSCDRMVRIVVVSLTHSFFNAVSIAPNFVASNVPKISTTSTMDELLSAVLEKYLTPAITLGNELSSEGTANGNATLPEPVETEEAKPVDTEAVEEDQLLAETESDWQDTDSTPSLDTIRSGPPAGALENLFKLETSEDLEDVKTTQKSDNKSQIGSSNLSIISLILRFVSHASRLTLAQVQQVKQIAINLISSVRVVSKSLLVLFNNIPHLTEKEFWTLIDAEGSFQLPFGGPVLSLYVSLVSQRAFSSIQSGDTEWFVTFILDNLEKLSCSTESDQNIRIFMQLVVVMLEYTAQDDSVVLSSLFFNLCTSISCSVANTLWLFNLLDVLLSKKPADYKAIVLKEFVELRDDWSATGRNFSEITGQLPLQPVTSIFSVDSLEADNDKVQHVKTAVGDELKVMFNLVVEEVFRRADSDSLISAIVVITRVTAKINPAAPSTLLKILCQLNDEDEDDIGKLQFLFTMIRERLDLALKNCSDHNLLLLSFCMSEIVKIACKLVQTTSAKSSQDLDSLEKMIDFFTQIMCDMLMLYESVVMNLSKLSDAQKLFLPVSKSVGDLRSVTNFKSGIHPFAEAFIHMPDSNSALDQLFKMISEYTNDGRTYANRIFQSYFSIFFLICGARETSNGRDQSSETKESAFSSSQQNELMKASVIIECSTIFEDFSPLRLYLKDFASDDVRQKKGELFLAKRIISIMQNILDKIHLLNSADIVINAEKVVNTLCSLSVFQSLLSWDLTESEKNTLIHFAICKHENVSISKSVQVPIFNCLLDHQKDILTEKKAILDNEKLSELFSSLTCWLTENYGKKSDTTVTTDATKQLLSKLAVSIFNKDLIEIGLARLVFDEKDDEFIALFEYLVTISNSFDDENSSYGHQKVIQVTKMFLFELTTKTPEEMISLSQSKKIVTILNYVTQLALHLDVQKRQPSSDLMNTEPKDTSNELNDKLCTYTTTQREFQNQHWYHCYTCEMFDSVGVCSVCAKVCHAGHQLSYAKYSSFFCDCGAQEQGTCGALTRRNTFQPLHKSNEGSVNFDIKLSSSDVKQVCTDVLVECSGLLDTILKVLCGKDEKGQANRDQGFRKAASLLEGFKTAQTRQVTNDTFSRAEFQTNEGALDNVKPTFSGEVGNQIRKILTENVIQRNYVALLHDGKEKFLLVLHDKNRLSLLALSSLLSKKSRGATMAVSRQSSTNISFPIMSLAVSSVSSNVIVCSTREVCVLLIDAGSFGRQISLNLNLTQAQFITRILWVPNSSVMMAVSTNENLKIFDLSKDVISPVYNFKPVSGIITDFTFLYRQKQLCLVVLTNEGTIYIQQLDKECTAEEHGEFYLSNDLQIAESFEGLGLAIHYSLPSEALFITLQNKNKGEYASYCIPNVDYKHPEWVAPKCIQLPPVCEIIKKKQFKQPSSKGTKSFKENLKDIKLEKKYFYMRNFTDINGHPGLLTTNIGQHVALITLLETDINVELLQDNRPILDIVGTAHSFRDDGGTSSQTSILAVAEDGALRGWTLNASKEDKTGIWKSVFDFNNNEQILNTYNTPASTESEYPVDFFEYCDSINEVEYTSPQLQRIYNRQQIRQRLAPSNTNNSSYVAWRGSFTINMRSSRLIRGFRIHLGGNGQDAVPPAVTLNGKRQFYFVDINRAKWVDVPFTPEEALEFNGKIALQFAASNHQDRRVIIDAIKVFGQSREKIMGEKRANDRRKIGQDITCLGPRDKMDVTRSMTVEALAASSNLITKATIRADMLDKVWTYLDHQHALMSSIRNCSRFLPDHVTFNRKRDIIVAAELAPVKVYDWRTFQQMAGRIYDIAKKRPENFRTYFTSQVVLNAFDHLVTEFGRLIKDDEEAGFRSIIFPSCQELRTVANQIVFVLALCALMDPTRIHGLVPFVTSDSINISFGARDAILEAMMMETSNLTSGLRLVADDTASVSDNDEQDRLRQLQKHLNTLFKKKLYV